MRLTRIMIVIAAGFALLGVPTAAGAAQPIPQPTATSTSQSPVPQPTATSTIPPSPPPTFPQPSYPPTQPSLTSPDPTIFSGEPVTLVGDNWAPNEPVRLTFSLLPTAARLPGAQADRGGVGAMAPVALASGGLPDPMEVEADGNGHFSVQVNIDQVGHILVTATGRDADGRDATATLVVNVLPRPTQPPSGGNGTGGLPTTGSSLSGPIGVGAVAVAVGALLMLAAVTWRRRTGRAGMR